MNIMIDSWYADHLEYDGFSFQSWLEERPWYGRLRPVIARIGVIRGILLFRCAQQSTGAVVLCDMPGFWTFLLLRALFGTPGECFVLEFIRRRPLRAIHRFIYPIWFNLLAAPAVRKAVSRAQVMTSWERTHYASIFGVDKDRLVHIPFPMIRSESSCEPVNRKDGHYIMSSGRNSCDWGTFVRAVSDLPEYPAVIIHSKDDRRQFRDLCLPEHITVFCEIPPEEHDGLLKRSTCYVITLHETMGSSGHVRLSHAITLGVPIIVTRNSGLDEYVTDGKTGIVVPPSDPIALRKAIARLMGNPSLQKSLSENAIRGQGNWTRKSYFDRLSGIVKKDIVRLP